jgi:hypothetical protein
MLLEIFWRLAHSVWRVGMNEKTAGGVHSVRGVCGTGLLLFLV